MIATFFFLILGAIVGIGTLVLFAVILAHLQDFDRD